MLKDKIWTFEKENNFDKKRLDSRVDLLLPEIGKLIPNDVSVLDFGCGEGYLSDNLKNNVKLYLYDINQSFLKLANKRANLNSSKKVTVLNKLEELKEIKVDYLVVSLVLITFATEEEFDQAFKIFNIVLKNKGKLIIADTHPCFRTHKFSTFKTKLRIKTFDYFKLHNPFGVRLLSNVKGKFIKFNDYHYNLTFIFKKLKEYNFQVDYFDEIKDIEIKGALKQNKNYPPYYILKSIKNEINL